MKTQKIYRALKVFLLFSFFICFKIPDFHAQLAQKTFSYTGTMQTFTVPSCVATITVIAKGANGVAGIDSPPQTYGGIGGAGARIAAVMNVTPGMILNLFVGGQNGFNGGGSAGDGGGVYVSGNGGGASDIRINGMALNNRVIVAAGGGGGAGGSTGTLCNVYGGNGAVGGNVSGGNGSYGFACNIGGNGGIGGDGGNGGTQISGGTGGAGLAIASCSIGGGSGLNGRIGIGAAGGNGTTCAVNRSSGGGGGGGGYFGGGGGGGGTGNSYGTCAGGGGGGGSSYIDNAFFSNLSYTTSSFPANGEFTLQYSFVAPGANLTVSDQSICQGETATISLPDMVTYTWSVGSNANNISVSPMTTTSYSVIATTSLGCMQSGMANITVSASPVISVSNTSPSLCIGQTSSLTASGANTYTWNFGISAITGNTISISPGQTTTYAITGQGLNGCTSTINYVAYVYPNPLTTSQNTTVCAGQEAVLTAYGASSYNWSNGSSGASITVSAMTSTVFTVTALDNNNCTFSGAIIVDVIPSPTVTIEPANSNICLGDQVTLIASGSSTYFWDNGVTTESVSVSSPISAIYHYSVTGMDANGCTNKASATVAVDVCTDISDNGLLDNDLRVFPNPTNGIFSVSTWDKNRSLFISVYNATGQLIKKQDCRLTGFSMDLSSETTGVYFITITENNKPLLWSKLVKFD